MRIIVAPLAAGLLLAATACNQGSDNELSTDVNLSEDAAANDVLGGSENVAANVGNAAAATMPRDAAGFAAAVAASDLYEIESSQLAQQKAQSADLKSFAQMLVREHQNSTAQLKTAAGQAGVTVTRALDAEKQALIDQLEGADGAAFDRMYIDQQRTAHQKALMLLQNYQAGGDNEALKGFARTAQTMVEQHLDRLNAMRN